MLTVLRLAAGRLRAAFSSPPPEAQPEVVREPPAAGDDPFRAQLIADLRRDEGEILHAYQDHLGYWTIGVGRLIDKRKGGGLTLAESAYLLGNDINRKTAELDRLMPWWRQLDAVRRRAVLNMAFQMGPNELAGTATFELIRAGRYAEAADRLQGWLWARQTPARARRIIHMIRTGTDPS